MKSPTPYRLYLALFVGILATCFEFLLLFPLVLEALR